MKAIEEQGIGPVPGIPADEFHGEKTLPWKIFALVVLLSLALRLLVL